MSDHLEPVLVLRNGRPVFSDFLEQVCDGDAAARSRHLWAGGPLRASTRIYSAVSRETVI